MIPDVIQRLKDQVTDFQGRVEGAAQLAALMHQNALPQVTPAAHVVPLGVQGGRTNAATGLFRQEIESLVGVLITLRTNSRTGGAQLPDLVELTGAVTTAIAGWAPAGAIGVFRLSRGQLVTMVAGTLIYQLDFALPDQLRIVA